MSDETTSDKAQEAFDAFNAAKAASTLADPDLRELMARAAGCSPAEVDKIVGDAVRAVAEPRKGAKPRDAK